MTLITEDNTKISKQLQMKYNILYRYIINKVSFIIILIQTFYVQDI